MKKQSVAIADINEELEADYSETMENLLTLQAEMLDAIQEFDTSAVICRALFAANTAKEREAWSMECAAQLLAIYNVLRDQFVSVCLLTKGYEPRQP